MSFIRKIFFVTTLLFIGIQIWGACVPSHWNWGTHLFAFYSPVVSIVLSIIALISFISKVQIAISKVLVAVSVKFSKQPLVMTGLVLCVCLSVFSLIFPARLHLLGDGALLLRVVAGMHNTEELPPNFDHQPLVGLIFESIQHYVQNNFPNDPEFVFRLLDGIFGAAYLALLLFFLRKVDGSPSNKIIIGCFLFFSAGTQFFLGYVELYVFLYVAVFAYLISAWRTIEYNRSIIVPILCFVLMVGLHYASIFLAPSLLLLFHLTVKNTRKKVIVSIIILISMVLCAAAVIVWFPSLSLHLSDAFSNAFRYNFLPLTRNAYFPYTLFSLHHVIDWLNGVLLIAPMALLTLPVIAYLKKAEIHVFTPLLLFLMATAFCGIVFTFAMNPALGLARDWDFQASFFLPLLMLSSYIILKVYRYEQITQPLCSVVIVLILFWIAWIGINSNEERHLRRMKMLNEPQLLGVVPKMNYYETLGNYFWYGNDPRQAKIFWEQYAEIDSGNPRTLANLSEVYRKLGENTKAFVALQKAANHHSNNPAVYMNLGVMFAQQGDTVSAITYNRQALSCDSTYGKAHGNLGILYLRKMQYQLSAYHLGRAIQLGIHEPFLYRDAGSASFFARDFQTSLSYFDEYLRMEPNDTKVRNVRDQLYQYLQSKQQR